MKLALLIPGCCNKTYTLGAAVCMVRRENCDTEIFLKGKLNKIHAVNSQEPVIAPGGDEFTSSATGVAAESQIPKKDV